MELHPGTKLIYFFLTGFDEKYKTPRKLKLIKKPFQDIFNNKKRNKKKTYRNVHFIREHLFQGNFVVKNIILQTVS